MEPSIPAKLDDAPDMEWNEAGMEWSIPSWLDGVPDKERDGANEKRGVAG